MSKLIVEICKISEIQPHNNADALELAVVKGWQLVVAKGRFNAGDLIVYVPIDSIIPPAVAEGWGVAQYLDKGRVRCAKLRGEPSYGVAVSYADEIAEGHLPARATVVVMEPDVPWPTDFAQRVGETIGFKVGNKEFTIYGDDLSSVSDYTTVERFNGFHPYRAFNPRFKPCMDGMERGEEYGDERVNDPHANQVHTQLNRLWQIGDDVAHCYGITKYQPKVRRMGGGSGLRHSEAMDEHPEFPKYTDIQNCRHFPHLIEDGTTVVVTEKIHGTNSRIGVVEGVIMAGSHKLRRKPPTEDETDMSTYSRSLYWMPMSIPGVRALLEFYRANGVTAVIYGEIYGPSIQNLGYGVGDGDQGYRVFDIKANGRYLNADEMSDVCAVYHIETVPILYCGPYTLDKIKALSAGTTTLIGNDPHIREGVVVKTAVETTHPKLGRVILKYVGDQYLFAKGVTDSEDE